MRLLLVFSILVILFFPLALSYDMDPPDETVHQHLTNESKLVWTLISPEIRQHLTKSIYSLAIDGDFDSALNEDIITGSAEDDIGPELAPFLFHFWEPDNPSYGMIEYDDGLLTFGSSYRRATKQKYGGRNL